MKRDTAEVQVIDGEALRKAILDVGSQTDVAYMAGLTPQRLSQLVTGDAPVIREDRAARLEEVLGVEYGTLFKAHRAHKNPAYLRTPGASQGQAEGGDHA